ncbi:flagellar protein FlgN [Thermovenabulum gondwanense]|uniref:FlgN protein n=1 Tax=Thermovenabulum gondwanense TaxID=520767 RepID=A0A161PV39_9FIRM|nr:flagellar protein FlgN [Thermovenabulum gondwanense]KYO64121.1 hypothetical protein ATZ99_21520 [Thermovenabulum gondwanense]
MELKDVDFGVLLKNLKEQLSIYEELLEIAKKKTDILVKNDIKHLEEITAIEQEMIVKLGKLEEERQEFIKDCSSHLNLNEDMVNSSYMINLFPEEIKKEMDEVTGKLRSTLQNLDEKNRLNESLIKSALEFINNSIELLVDAAKFRAGYGADGKLSEKEGMRIIDKKL